MKPQILIIEDDPALGGGIENLLTREGYHVTRTTEAADGLELARGGAYDAVLTDLELKSTSIDGLEITRQLHDKLPRLPVVMMTGFGTEQVAIQAMKHGAFDFILKDAENTFLVDLLEMIERAVKTRQQMNQPVWLPDDPDRTRDTAVDAIRLIGRSRVMQETWKQIGQLAGKDIAVLIEGPTGTGKELVARALYQHSRRAKSPFVAVNCAAIPETLLESELFGHERGAFTGAHRQRIGRFEQADGGTIFLDEIGDLSPATQPKLLRVLEQKTIRRLGGDHEIEVDVRVLAATHRQLESAVREGTFREDLYHRLYQAAIHLPPLRERGADVAELAKHFLAKHGAPLGVDRPPIHETALGFLADQPWPGNVRELENVIRRAIVKAAGQPISIDHLRAALVPPSEPAMDSDPQFTAYIRTLLQRAADGEVEDIQQRILTAVERELYAQAIAFTNGNQSEAAKLLGVSRPTMREKLVQYNLHPGRSS